MADPERSPRRVSLIVDTNLFHECRKLDAADFPWSAIGEFDEIGLIVTYPVIQELDKHKKDTRPRLKRRALLATTWFRELLDQRRTEKVLKDADPRVVLRMRPVQAPKADMAELDYDVVDDRIVGIAAAIAEQSPDEDVRLLSHDSGPCMKAAAIGLQYQFMPDDWMREEEEDEQEKENRRLREEIKRLRSQAPALKVTADGAAQDRKVVLRREGFAPLTDAELGRLKDVLERRVPLPPIYRAASSPATNMLLGYPPTKYVPPSAESVEKYRVETYPGWVESCIVNLRSASGYLNRGLAAETLTVRIVNEGTRPASDVVVKFAAQGGFLIAPPPYGDNPRMPALPPLPGPPSPPKGHRERNGMVLAEVHHRPFQEGLIRPIPDIASGHFRPNREEDDFYYHPGRPKHPVQEFELVCGRFRHGVDPEPFEILVYPRDEEEVVRGAISVSVHASNLDQPLEVSFPVQVVTTFRRQICEQAESLINALKPPKDG